MKHWVVCAADYGFWGRCVFFWLFDNFIVDIVRCLEPPGRYLKRQQWFTVRSMS